MTNRIAFTVLPDTLRAALRICLPAINRSSTLPILATVRLTARTDALECTATNLEAATTCRVGAKTHQGGAICVNAHKLMEIVTNWPGDDDMHCSADTGALSYITISGPHAEFRLRAYDPDDFPLVPETAVGDEALFLPRGRFLTALEHVLYACAPDNTRPALHGVHVTLTHTRLTLQGCDAFRLAEESLPVTYAGQPCQFIISLPTARHIRQALAYQADMEQVIAIQPPRSAPEAADGQLVAPSIFVIQDDKLVMRARAVEAAYPDVETVIPQGAPALVLRAEAWRAALNSLRIMARHNADRLVCRLIEDGDFSRLHMRAESADYGSAEAATPASLFAGAPSPISFQVSALFLQQALAAFPSDDSVQVVYISPQHPLLLLPVSLEARHVIMPLVAALERPSADPKDREEGDEPAAA